MSKILRRHPKKAGLPPGSLIYLGDKRMEGVSISLIHYDSNQLVEKKNISLQDCLLFLNTTNTTWINICGISDSETIELIGRHFGLHPLLLEDIMTPGQRSKVDNYKDTLYIIVKLLAYQEKNEEIDDEQVSLILGKNFVISFLESRQDIFSPIRQRLNTAKSRMRQRGADYLCYTLIDCLVDNYFLILEKIDEKLGHLEDELIRTPKRFTLQKIHHAKREIVFLRKAIWPMREVVSNLVRIESPLIHDPTRLYLQDVYDHVMQAIETIESFRDIIAGAQDIYLSSINQRMNEIIKVLTIVATIFVPLTFIASLYGMNFDYLPGMHSKWGFLTIVGCMIAIFMGMLYYFKRKRWIF